jgi:anti-anti-sigma factor
VDFSSRSFADVVVATPAGRIDHDAAGSFEQAMAPWLDPARSDIAALILDFARVAYISSVGLRVLMVAAKTLRARRARVAVTALQPTVAEIFAISRFDNVVDVFPSVRSAIAASSAAALAAFDASQGSPQQ